MAGLKSLIVEDNVVDRQVLEIHLNRLGTVEVAANGFDAVNQYEKVLKEHGKYDLICLDIMMPKMDGQEALRRIRRLEENHKRTGSEAAKIIMTTSSSDVRDMLVAFSEGLESYLIKPITEQKLSAELEKLGLVHTALR